MKLFLAYEIRILLVGPHELLMRSDIVSIHVPLTNATKNWITAEKLALMKANAILINVGRGNMVNEEDLYDALCTGKIFGAGIDVWATEPVGVDNPLLTLDNVVAPPISAVEQLTQLSIYSGIPLKIFIVSLVSKTVS
jgi:phosphoglycerate dehydrogenase-like enzyme